MLNMSRDLFLLAFFSNGIHEAACFGIGGNLPVQTDPTPSPSILLTTGPTKNPVAPPTITPTLSPTRSPTVMPTEITESTDISFSFRFDLFVQSDNEVFSAIDYAEQMARNQVEMYMANTEASLTSLSFSSTILDAECSSDPWAFLAGACKVFETTVSATVGAVVEPDLVGRVFTDEIRKSYVEDFNSQSDSARIIFGYPIVVKASQLLELDGASRPMTADEVEYFLLHVSSLMEGVLRLHTDPIAFEFQDATVINQEVREASPPQQPFGSNIVRVQLRAICGNANVCTDAAFQALVDTQAPSFGQPLQQSLTIEGDEINYFNAVQDVFMQGKPIAVIPTFPPTSSPNVPDEGRKRIPLWVWMLVLVDAVIVIALIAYVSHKRKRRVVQGDKLQDPKPEAAPKRLSLPSVPFPLKQKQIDKNKEDNNIMALEAGDDEYDAKSYDFSVEAADLSNGDYSAANDMYYAPR